MTPAQAGSGWSGTFAFAVVVAAVFTVIGFAVFAHGEGAWRNWSGWAHWYGVNLVVSLCISYAIHGLYTLGYALFGRARLHALNGVRRTLYFAGVPLLGLLIGWPAGAWLSGYELIRWPSLSDTNGLVSTLLVTLVITGIFQLLFNAKQRQLQAEKRAAEAQLRLLQGQIEPHFLFNTLANVQALIDTDAAKARQMLESFTDYLRASLGALRRDEATLGSELQLVEHYLSLLKSRMEDRLQFRIEHDPALHDARLPPLLLQPLVENAIHHGLEPKLEGGCVRVSTRVEGGRLVVEVADDGLGLRAPPRRRGAGVALANLRERLAAQYGADAGLVLADAHPGTVATLRLPLLKPLSKSLLKAAA